MNILVIGSGAREHALIWKLSQSKQVNKIFCSPGNGGISALAKIVPACAEGDWDSYADFAKKNKVGLTVVGPEVPLAGGIVDVFQKRSLKIFGPDKSCARFEGSKIFAKLFMKKYGIPTADFEVFENPQEALESIHIGRVVVKADGLAAGKGVSVCDTAEQAKSAIEEMMVQKVFGKAGEKILIEKRLTGLEVSLMAFCDGETLRNLPPARDYKRVNDNDQGPNTGGMGAICPVPIPEPVLQQVQQEILQPFLHGLKAERLNYRGLIYFGLMLTEKGPFVLEFNVRFGDPETQVVLPLIKTDLLQLLTAVADQKLEEVPLEISEEACVGVVCASGGYPGKFENNQEIWGINSALQDKKVMVFHAGTVEEKEKYYTHGGRVLTVVGKDPSLKEAKRRAYGGVFKIQFNKMHYRNDIGKRETQETAAQKVTRTKK